MRRVVHASQHSGAIDPWVLLLGALLDGCGAEESEQPPLPAIPAQLRDVLDAHGKALSRRILEPAGGGALDEDELSAITAYWRVQVRHPAPKLRE